MKDIHIVLVGPPGIGKSQVTQVIKDLLLQKGVKTETVYKKFDEPIIQSDYCLKLTEIEASKIIKL